MHVRILPILRCEMPLISCIKGDHLIIPGVLDQGATAEHRPMLFFLMKGGGWKGSLSIACSVPQASLCRHTTGGLHHATTLKKPILKQSQRQTLTLETGTCPLTPGSPQLFEGGGCLNLHPSRLSHLNQQEIRKFVL